MGSEMCIRDSYSDFPEDIREDTALQEILQDGIRRGIYFLSDQDARPAGSASPATHLWDNGKDPVTELTRIVKVREVAMNMFGENALRMNAPVALLEDVLVPLYLLPRYQITAAAKVIGGVDYRYNLRGDGQKLPEPVSAEKQREAMNTLLWVVSPVNLVLPEKLLRLLPPRPLGYPATRESFSGYTDPVFDPLVPARDICEITYDLLLNSERAARMIRNHALDQVLPGFDELLEIILKKTWFAPHTGNGYQDLALQISDRIVLEKIILLLQDDTTDPAVREIAWNYLLRLKQQVIKLSKKEKNNGWKAHYQYTLKVIKSIETEKVKTYPGSTKPVPPGQPIGNDAI